MTNDSKRSAGQELARTRAFYELRDASPVLARLYAPLSQAALLALQERDWHLAAMLRELGYDRLAGVRILDVGCAFGTDLVRFVAFGADPELLAGIDLAEPRIAVARQRLPAADIRAGSAHELPFATGAFDLVTQFSTLSGIVSRELRAAAAREMWRVLRPGGAIISYDVRRVRGRPPGVVPVSERQLRRLFADGRVTARSIGLDQGILQRVVPRSRTLASLLGRVPFLTTHLLAAVRSVPSSGAGAPGATPAR